MSSRNKVCYFGNFEAIGVRSVRICSAEWTVRAEDTQSDFPTSLWLGVWWTHSDSGCVFLVFLKRFYFCFIVGLVEEISGVAEHVELRRRAPLAAVLDFWFSRKIRT